MRCGPNQNALRPMAWALYSALVFLLSVGVDLPARSEARAADPAGSWQVTGSMNRGNYDHDLVLLPSGKVFTTGDLFDPSTGMWTATAPSPFFVEGTKAVVLANGLVLVTDGKTNAVRYDPATDSWDDPSQLLHERRLYSMIGLGDGRVIATGGVINGYDLLASVEIYDPATNAWSDAAPMQCPRYRHQSTLLADGRVMVMGGTESGAPDCQTRRSTVEIYDPVADQWTTAKRRLPRRIAYDFQMLRLLDGRVLVTGGIQSEIPALQLVLRDVLLYDPVRDRWKQRRFMQERRANHQMTLLADGRVLVSGGRHLNALSTPDGYHIYDGATSAEVYDVATNRWTPAGDMAFDRYSHGAVLLGSGQVLVSGGWNKSTCGGSLPELTTCGIGEAELFTAAPPP